MLYTVIIPMDHEGRSVMKIGEKIRELRRRDGRTQEALARELGITAQAVSRWEKGICCPDVEMLPSIANYFDVTIDELFGYDNHRAKRVEAAAKQIEEMLQQNNGVDVCMDDCVRLARQSLIEFPGNERLTFLLASALYTEGYVRRGELHREGSDGYSVYDVERHRTYPEWQEAMRLFEKLVPAMADGPMKQEAIIQLSQLYKNTGAQEKALALAKNAPDIQASKLFLRINAFDGQEAVAACGEALLETVRLSAELMVRIVLSDQYRMDPGTAADLLQNAVGMFDLICTDGYYGRLGAFAACLHILRSYFLWLSGNREGAFAALDAAAEQAGHFDALPESGAPYFTSPLLRYVKTNATEVSGGCAFRWELPEVWPWWDVAEKEKVKGEMAKDTRWAAWMKRCGA